MNKTSILVVEGEFAIASRITESLKEIGYNVLDPITNCSKALQKIENEKPNLILLDIQLKGAIDLAWKIKENYKTPYIFISSNPSLHIINKNIRLSPASYMIKPFGKKDLYATIELVLHKHSNPEMLIKKNDKKLKDQFIIKDAIFVKKRNLLHKVLFKDILYLKSDHVYIEIYTINGQKFLIRDSLTKLTQKLPKNFFRTHRSYTINLNHLEGIDHLKVSVGGHQILIAKNHRNTLLDCIQYE